METSDNRQGAITALSISSQFIHLTEAREAPDGMPGLWVVRPDGYVGLAAQRDDAAAAKAYLAAISP